MACVASLAVGGRSSHAVSIGRQNTWHPLSPTPRKTIRGECCSANRRSSEYGETQEYSTIIRVQENGAQQSAEEVHYYPKQTSIQTRPSVGRWRCQDFINPAVIEFLKPTIVGYVLISCCEVRTDLKDQVVVVVGKKADSENAQRSRTGKTFPHQLSTQLQDFNRDGTWL